VREREREREGERERVYPKPSRRAGSYETPTPKLPDAELSEIAHYHVGETITSVCKAKLVEGGTGVHIFRG